MSITLPGPHKEHPLVRGLDEVARVAIPASTVAKAMGIAPQTLYIWRKRCRADRNYLLPAERVLALSQITDIAPYFFRPDLWPKKEWKL
jgi:hypothetical protein